jgi:spore coat polysaccharide biosynthesis predicted glycosyltransferase SpsG
MTTSDRHLISADIIYEALFMAAETQIYTTVAKQVSQTSEMDNDKIATTTKTGDALPRQSTPTVRR